MWICVSICERHVRLMSLYADNVCVHVMCARIYNVCMCVCVAY